MTQRRISRNAADRDVIPMRFHAPCQAARFVLGEIAAIGDAAGERVTPLFGLDGEFRRREHVPYDIASTDIGVAAIAAGVGKPEFTAREIAHRGDLLQLHAQLGRRRGICDQPRDRHDAHRAVRKDEDLEAIFAWREYRKVTDSLTLRYERKMYLIQDTSSNRRYIGKFIEVFQFPDGRIEIRVAGVSLPYSTYNKIGTIDHGAIVDNKRLSQVLRTAKIVQAQRDDRVIC